MLTVAQTEVCKMFVAYTARVKNEISNYAASQKISILRSQFVCSSFRFKLSDSAVDHGSFNIVICLIWCLFVLSCFPRDVLDEILDLIESVFEGFPIYSLISRDLRGFLFIMHYQKISRHEERMKRVKRVTSKRCFVRNFDAANALWRDLGTSFNQSNVVIMVNVSK